MANEPAIPMEEALRRLREQFPGMEIVPEENGACAIAAKHDGKWRAWWFKDAITEYYLKALADGLRNWRGEL